MQILIIGCGYVGKAMALHWKDSGYTITVTTRNSEKIADLKSYAHKVFLLENKSLQQPLIQQEAVLLCVAPDNSSDYSSTYLETARQLISDLIPSVKQIIYTSSTSIYGDFKGAEVNENTPPHPTSSQSKILLETENILMESASTDRKVCILRLGEIIGPNRTIEQRLQSRIGMKFPGTGENITNLSPLEDIVAGIDFALKQKLYGIYNLCCDFHMTRKEWYHDLCNKAGIPQVEWDMREPTLHGGNKLVSSSKIKSLGFNFLPIK